MKKLFLFVLLFIMPIFCYADSARSSIVMDIDSNRVLYENNADKKSLIASITKIMTAVIAIENGNLNDEVVTGDEILKMYGTSIYLEVGEKMKLLDLLYGLMLRSGNDASVVIAKHIAGSEEKFVEMMNDKAKELGMNNTIFNNPHGLDEKTKNYSTARDMAILSSYAYKNHKIYRTISGKSKYKVKTENKSYLWYNRVKLINNYEYCTGGKNGYTPSAGKTLVSTHEKNDLRITVVTLHDSDEYSNHKLLAENTFNKYRNYNIVSKNDFDLINDDKTYYIKKDFSYPLTYDEVNNINVVANIDDNIKNGKVGNIKITLRDETIESIPVYIKKNKKKTSFFSKLFS